MRNNKGIWIVAFIVLIASIIGLVNATPDGGMTMLIVGTLTRNATKETVGSMILWGIGIVASSVFLYLQRKS